MTAPRGPLHADQGFLRPANAGQIECLPDLSFTVHRTATPPGGLPIVMGGTLSQRPGQCRVRLRRECGLVRCGRAGQSRRPLLQPLRQERKRVGLELFVERDAVLAE